MLTDFQDGRRSNVAIVSEPFYGDGILLDQIEEMVYPRSIRLKASGLADGWPPETDKSIVIVQDLHHLYLRRIGGFEKINRFLDGISTSSDLFIITCNSFSWKYLDRVCNIKRLFPVVLELPSLTSSQIRDLLLSEYREDELNFEVAETPPGEKPCPVRLSKKEVLIKPLGKRFYRPSLEIQVRDVRDILPCIGKKVEMSSPRDLVFEKLARMSGGNPGVVEVLWRGAMEYPNVRADMLKEDSSGVDLDYDHSFILSIILSMGIIRRDGLAQIAGPVDEALYVLKDRGLITRDGDSCSIRMESFKKVVDHLKRNRLVS
ncbi:MAG: hypothetical protein GKC10_07050 [Methanosarcinales archaeon]|nr:hypothetical protein [Methanosarcinales archaeon]